MATFRITPATSVYTTLSSNAFASDTLATADSLIVDADAFLISSGGIGAYLSNTDAWTVTINGFIVSRADRGLLLAGGNFATSTISIGSTGEVGGRSIAMAIASPATLNNYGEITARDYAVYLTGAGTHTINNKSTGTISASTGGLNFAILDDTNLSIEKVSNSGVINGNISLGGNNDTLTNGATATINGRTELGEGTNKLTNKGVMKEVQGGSGTDTIVNSGTLQAVNTFGGNDTFYNYATTTTGVVAGTVLNSILMGDGTDKFLGSDTNELLTDGGGTDSVKFAGGNDWYNAIGTGVDGTDTVDGGLGVDTYSAVGANGSLIFNLDTVSHDLAPISPGAGVMTANTVRFFPAGGGSIDDKITGFENAIGSEFYDAMYGSAGANVLEGRGSGDNILGFGGDDRLIGGAGADALAGGAGKDTLYGGSEGDIFQYFLTSDSTVAKAGRDIIMDWHHEVGVPSLSDRIDVSFIDADTTVAGNQAFHFLATNAAFDGSAGALRDVWTANGHMIQGDVNRDKIADFAIEILDPDQLSAFGSSDFIL